MAFHVEQRQAGNEIINKFTREQPFTVLLAQMQSGKTGTYLFTAFEMIRLGLVKNAAIICGSSDTSLRAQAQSDMETSLKTFQEETMEAGDMEGALRLHRATIGVYFSQHTKVCLRCRNVCIFKFGGYELVKRRQNPFNHRQ